MKHDIFFSISQTPGVAGDTPSENEMFDNYFEQLKHADNLGFRVGWIAQAHLSTETQKSNSQPVVPHWQGEVGLCTDFTQLALESFRATKNIDIVIHAAALKHVPFAEYNPMEAVNTNIFGSNNLINACIKNKVKKCMLVSTDKAVNPINLYGATKLASDKLFVSANNYKGSREIKFSVVRYGNVFGSRGSVVPFFLEKEKTGVLPITDKKMTRFSITLQEGVDFVIQCFQKMWGGEIFVPKIPSYRIMDLVESIDPNLKIKIIGIRPGEKVHEQMITESDAINSIEFEDYYVILPSIELWDKRDFIQKSSSKKGRDCPKEGFSYISSKNDNFLSVNDLKILIERL